MKRKKAIRALKKQERLAKVLPFRNLYNNKEQKVQTSGLKYNQYDYVYLTLEARKRFDIESFASFQIVVADRTATCPYRVKISRDKYIWVQDADIASLAHAYSPPSNSYARAIHPSAPPVPVGTYRYPSPKEFMQELGELV